MIINGQLPRTHDGRLDYRQLVFDDRVHSAVYTDEEVFADEMSQIFENFWIYVGHASEVPTPGDYRLKRMGRKSVIMTRDREGQLRLLMNRCRHRAAVVCHREQGSAAFFRCGYHGWTYRNDGRLVGVPFPAAYGEEFDKTQYGLTQVTQVGEYRGFIFASLGSPEVSFEEYLTGGRQGIDMFVGASPEGEIEVRAGVTKMAFKGNWKYVGMDGYHPEFTHRSVQDIMAVKAQEEAKSTFSQYGENSKQRAVDMGNGHVRLDEQQEEVESLLTFARRVDESDANRRYRELMEAAYGPELGVQRIWQADPHMHVWPNLQLTGSHIRVLIPGGPGMCYVECYPALLKGVPEEINVARLRGHEWFHGPASFGTPDDGEMFERAFQGNLNDLDPWLLFSRGLHREAVDAEGNLAGNITDETTDRGRFRQWLNVMAPQKADVLTHTGDGAQ